MKDYKLSEIKAICKSSKCSYCKISALCKVIKKNSPSYWKIEEQENENKENN